MAEGELAKHESRRSIHRVLIMGGSRSEASLLTQHFQRLGCTVEHVSTAEAGMEAARTRIPDLVIINRQWLSSSVASQNLIDELCDDPATAGCRVAVASGLEFEEVLPDVPGTHEIGADEVLNRPYTRASIQQLIDRVDTGRERRGSTPDDIGPP